MKAISCMLSSGMLVTGLLASAQVRTPDFLIDPSKDYVYLEFHHLVSRERIGGDEVSQGLWIRLVNNCRVPVVVALFNPGTDDRGSGIYLSFPRVHD